jgi:hypothetical protein
MRIKKFNESVDFVDEMGKSPDERILMEMEGYFDAIEHNLDLIIDEYMNLAQGDDNLIQNLISDLEKTKHSYDLQWIVERKIKDLKDQ